MHDPLIVAFQIRRPWPRRVNWTGRRWYWPPIVTVWHREPRGHDSGEVCKHYVKTQQSDGTWKMRMLHGWKFHVHHWKIQIHSLQELRRRLLTRCAWCGGRSTKRDPVNQSHSWNGSRGRWWRGEPGLYHDDCSSVSSAHAACLCDEQLTDYEGWGICARCGKRRSYGIRAKTMAIHRGLILIPVGTRDRARYESVVASVKDGAP